MASPLPPDPYIALGVPKDASSGTIKGAYRKLVLKFHPDKVSDEAQKQAASDQFHKIQTAYEIIGDEDRRGRYDAQCKLAELRRDVMERQGGSGSRVEVRTAAFRQPTDSPGRTAFTARGPERSQTMYEERRPYDAEYFDMPRATTRKDYEYERGPKRTSPRDDREQVRYTRQQEKENERARQKVKARQTMRDTHRNRDRKYQATISEEDSDSSDSAYESKSKRQHDDEQQRAAQAYYDQVQAQKEAAQRGMYADDRTRKMFASDPNPKLADAASYIERSRSGYQYPETESRRATSPVRAPSNHKIEYVKRGDGRPIAVRRGSGRPAPRDREEESPRVSSQREREGERDRPRRSSAEIVDESRRPQPPPLNQTKSAPQDIRIPSDKHRSYSLQADSDRRDDVPPPLKRAETMPTKVQAATRKPTRPSMLRESVRHTDYNDGLPTPAATPDWNGDKDRSSEKYPYRTQYADDGEYATPDGYKTKDEYRTEVREPSGPARRITRSPSPIREPREKPRAASSRYPTAQPPRPSRTTSYVYTPSGVEAMSARPTLSREESSRGSGRLYGELPTTRSPKLHRGKYSPPPEDVRYTEKIRPEQIRVQSGYSTGNSRRASDARPSYSRTNSFNNSPVYAS